MVSVMPLAEFTAKFSPAYPGETPSWDNTIQYLLNDPVENEIVTNLLDCLAKDGKFREPVHTGVGVHYEENSDEVIETDVNIVSMGTHRMAALIISGAEFVEYVSDEESNCSQVWDDEPTLLTRIQFNNPNEAIKTDIIMHVLRSFPISDKEWVTADLNVATGNTFTMYYEGADFNEENKTIIANIVKEKLTVLGYDINQITIDMMIFDENDDGLSWV